MVVSESGRNGGLSYLMLSYAEFQVKSKVLRGFHRQPSVIFEQSERLGVGQTFLKEKDDS